MGWRDRDYAKWTDEERRRFLGTPAGGNRSGGSAPGARRVGVLPGAGLAIAVSAAAFALGQLPRGHPIVPALHFDIPSIGSHTPTPASASSGEARLGKIRLPRRAHRGGFLTIQGQMPPGVLGTVSLEGAYGRPPWHLLAAVPSQNGSYRARIPLTGTGLLHVRITFPDGRRAVGAMRVVP
ncbi:MAG TPA: hypothetical protein VE088_00855 [Gaiellaceae bacterium]|jgi:hypothetical protein|nr:hypothetical protein [Gaiellaceae bacterium]